MQELGERLATEQNEKWKQETRRRERQKKKEKEKEQKPGERRVLAGAGWIKESAGFSTWGGIDAILDAAT